MKTFNTQVLIVGGGPVGLATSIFLSAQGIRSILVERNDSTSRHPKARGVNARAMELLRQIGCEHPLRAAAEPKDMVSAFGSGDHIHAENFVRVPFGAADLTDTASSPSPGVVTSQDVVEEILYGAAKRHAHTDIRFRANVLSFEQSETQVTVTVEDHYLGPCEIRAEYLIAADGARSFVRKSLGVPLVGSEPLTHNLNVMFEAPLSRKLADLKVAFVVIREGGRMAILSGRPTGRNDNQWTYNVQLQPDETEDDFPEDRLSSMIRQACDDLDLEITINNIAKWTATAQVAETLRVGRIFFVGDAAHMMPPAGALGMNTGLQDTHNLCWKLAGVLNGWADDKLLDSYHAERHPICDFVVKSAQANLAKLQSESGRKNMWGGSQQGIILGFTYDSDAIVGDGTDAAAPENPYSDYLPNGRPGGRAPHLPLRGRTQRSTLDLFGEKFVILTGANGDAWRNATRDASSDIDAPLDCLVADDDLELDGGADAFHGTYGVTTEGAVIVRPDGFVAWRSASAVDDHSATLRSALRQVACLRS